MTDSPHPSYYEVISNPEKRLAHEGGFLLSLLSAAPGKRVLDMACATGVHAEFLAENGAAVSARDMSEDSIGHARRHRSHPNVTYCVHDLCVPYGRPFDLVILMGNTLSLLDSKDHVHTALQAMKLALAPGGVGFVHVVNYTALEAGGPRHKVVREKTQHADITVVKNMMPCGKGGGALISFACFENRDGRWTTWGSQSVLLDITKDFLERAAAGAGLDVAAIYGDYDKSPFDETTSPDLLMVLKNGAARR